MWLVFDGRWQSNYHWCVILDRYWCWYGISAGFIQHIHHIRGDCHHIWLKSSINIAWGFPPGSVPPSLSADSCSWHWLYCCTCKAGAAFVNPPIYVGLVDECRAGWLFYVLFTWLMSLAGSQVCPLVRVEESKMHSLEMLKAHGDSAKLLVVPQYVGFLVQPQRQWGWSQVLSEDSLLHQDQPLFCQD